MKRKRLYWLRANAAGLRDEVSFLKRDYLSQISFFWRYIKISIPLNFYLMFARSVKWFFKGRGNFRKGDLIIAPFSEYIYWDKVWHKTISSGRKAVI